MDANTVWEWRIMHVKKYSKHSQPFHHSSRMGLDFNVGSKEHKKMDLQSLTSDVILELYDFAKTVKTSEWQFITNILQNNFDLGLKNEQQQIEFTSQIQHKIKDLIQNPVDDKHEVFLLFDMLSEPECDSNSKNGLNMASPGQKTESFPVNMDDTDESERVKFSQASSKENVKTEETDESHEDDSDAEDEVEGSEYVLPRSFPCCEEIGLNLNVDSKQSLDLGLLTKGVMLELLHFTRVLTANCKAIILSVLEHNFKFEDNFEGEKEKLKIWFKALHLLMKRKQRLNSIRKEKYKISRSSKSFPIQINPCQKAPAQSNVGGLIYPFKSGTNEKQSGIESKQVKSSLGAEQSEQEATTTVKSDQVKSSLRRSEQVTKQLRVERSVQKKRTTVKSKPVKRPLRTSERLSKRLRGQQADQEEAAGGEEVDYSYMCPLDSDEATESENDSESQNPATFDNCGESETSSLGTDGLFNTTSGESFSLPRVNTYANSPCASQPDAPNVCDMDEKEMETKSNMWKLRANRVKQIVFLEDREYFGFHRSKKFGLEFDVGFGPKQNFSFDSLTNTIMVDVAKFALAINSSQQDFLVEILEHNFNLGLWSESQRKTFAYEVMNRVKQLENSEDAVKFSNKVFELPVPLSSVNTADQRTGSDLSSLSIKEESDVASAYRPGSDAEMKDLSVNPYPFCKEIGLKLNVISSQPNKKLEINTLTNGAMNEVANFAEKLCGTFEQLCIDVIKHNFDLHQQSEDSELAKTILAGISSITEKRNLISFLTSTKKLNSRMTTAYFSDMVRKSSQSDPSLVSCGTGPSQAPTVDKNKVITTDTEQQNEFNLMLWKVRKNRIQHILSVPHGEQCPFYSYSRCKKIGIDFNVGSGIKLNLDPTLLTNGIMVELTIFATELLSAQKDFTAEILNYNFPLNLNNEFCQSIFARQVLDRIRGTKLTTKSILARKKIPFELPDPSRIDISMYPRVKYCPKCFQDRNSKLHQDESDPDHMLHPHPQATDTVSNEENCSAEKSVKDLSPALQTVEKVTMDIYRDCKKIGLSLWVDKDQPKEKLSLDMLTHGVMKEVYKFAKRLCGTKHKIINDILEHNFKLGKQSQNVNAAFLFQSTTGYRNKTPNWFSEVFVVQPCPPKDRGGNTKKQVSDSQIREWKDRSQNRQLALQIKKERATLPSGHISFVKPQKSIPRLENFFPICSKIGLDLDVTSKSADKEKLPLNLLTRAVVMEIYKFTTKKMRHYLPDTLFDILDYNFDLSSQHHRRWEFSLATATKVKTMAKTHLKNLHRANEVFKLPFMSKGAASCSEPKRQNYKSGQFSIDNLDEATKEDDSTAVRQIKYHSDVSRVYFHDVKTEKDFWSNNEDLQGNREVKQEKCDPYDGFIKQEPDTEENYHFTEDVDHLVKREPAGTLGCSSKTVCPDSE